MLQIEETRLSKQLKPTPTHHDNSSSSTVLYAGSDGNSRNTPNNNYHNSGRGNRGRNRGNGRSRGKVRYNNWPLNQFGLPWYYNQQPPVYAPMPPQFVYPSHGGYPPFSTGPAPPFQHQHGSTPHQGILGSHPSRPNCEAHMAQLTTIPQITQIPAGLAHAFNTMTLQEPDNAWYMESGASTHITSNACTLQSLFNKSTIPPVTVGNGSIAAVQNSGDGILVSPSRSFALNNVLVCPNIIKNLISVRKFVTDNSCAIDFDPFGFCVKDLRTRTKLLRCNSSGPLYSVTPSPPLLSHSAFTTTSLNGSVWHARLGHPSNATLSRILSFFSPTISISDLTTLCQACQLGKHTRLPFYNSSTIVSHPFDIVHSDIWTSPIASPSGLKYYLIFLDHYSHFLWVYPLHRKSDTFGFFLHFSNYVQTQFHCSIKSLQCDNGGEYDNRIFQNHLASTRTLMRFSCPIPRNKMVEPSVCYALSTT